MPDKKTTTKKPPAKKPAAKSKVKAKPKPKPKAKAEASDTTIAPDLQAVDPRLLERLVCPKTGGALTYDRTQNELVSKKAKLAYAIRGGVPIMLPDEARPL